MRKMFPSMKPLLAIVIISAFILVMPAQAATVNYTVQPNDTFWKIAVKYEVSLQELIQANPQIQNPNWIYPFQSIQIPEKQTTPSTNSNEQSTEQTTTVLEWEQQVVDLVNEERAKVGLSPLQLDTALSNVARYKSADMRDKQYFSHQSPTYGSPFEMMDQFGIEYQYAGENIAAGQVSPEAVMEAWMNSQGHRENILNPNYTHIGVGYVSGGSYQHYWTQQFVGR